MDTDAYWRLISDSLDFGPGRIARQAFLQEQLAMLSASDIVAVGVHLDRASDRAYSWDLVGAAKRIFGGWLSDDSFEYFRRWLIGCGRGAFDMAVADPDSLSALPEVQRLAGRHFRTWNCDLEWPEWESLAYVAIDAYGRVTGEDECAGAFYAAVKAQLAGDNLARRPRGEYWDTSDDAASAARLPNLTAMFPPRALI
ncbi:hypothetical protein ABH926_007237 [Catenulispora sp. GP43]|uniref:DUF4240 domain-containing protein n=1 Tax=Catenulispora sp. GP43 TaxID=3156263 RepID=UPI003516DCCF